MQPRDLLAAAAVVVIWGSNFVVMKFGLRELTPFQLAAGRFLFAMLPLALWVRPPPIPWRWLAAHSLVQGVGQFTLLFIALQVGMTAALASVLMQTQVFFTAVLGALLLQERIDRRLRLGLAIAGLGLACFAVDLWRNADTRVVTVAGLALNLLAASMWGAANIVVRRIQASGVRYDAVALVVWSSALSGASFLVLSLLFDDPAVRWRWTEASLGAWASVAYLGWGATTLAYGVWTWLLKRYPASQVAPLSLGMPVVGMLAGILVLDEVVRAWQWVGAALVISALWFVVRRQR